jgi:hypothetical protein
LERLERKTNCFGEKEMKRKRLCGDCGHDQEDHGGGFLSLIGKKTTSIECRICICEGFVE